LQKKIMSACLLLLVPLCPIIIRLNEKLPYEKVPENWGLSQPGLQHFPNPGGQ
jgi:hypothetical protein